MSIESSNEHWGGEEYEERETRVETHIDDEDDNDHNLKEDATLFNKKKPTRGDVGFWETVFVFFKSSFGVGLLGVPFAFVNSGLLAGIMGVILVCGVSGYTCKLMVHCKRELHTLGVAVQTFSDIAFEVWGRKGRIVSDILLVICQEGTCCAYCVFIATSLSAVFSSFNVVVYDLYLFAALLPVLLAFSLLITDVKKMTPFLICAKAIMFCCLFLIMFYGIATKSNCGGDLPPHQSAVLCPVRVFRLETLPVFFGVVTYALEGTPTVLPIEASMREPERVFRVLDIGMFALGVVYIVFGTCAYFVFGSGTRDVIDLNTQGWVGVIVKVLLVTVLLFTYPMILLPITDVCESLLVRLRSESTRNILLRACKVFSCIMAVIFAKFVPHFGHLLSLLGCVTFSIVAYIMPPWMYLKLNYERRSTLSKFLCYFCMAFGTAVLLFGLASNITSLIALAQEEDTTPSPLVTPSPALTPLPTPAGTTPSATPVGTPAPAVPVGPTTPIPTPIPTPVPTTPVPTTPVSPSPPQPTPTPTPPTTPAATPAPTTPAPPVTPAATPIATVVTPVATPIATPVATTAAPVPPPTTTPAPFAPAPAPATPGPLPTPAPPTPLPPSPTPAAS